MGKLNVKNGTPVGNEHLCKSCTWGLFSTGYRESDVLAFCTSTNPNFKVPFPVHECSGYQDKHKPDWEQMKKLAIDIEPTRTSHKTAGFSLAELMQPERPETNIDEDEEVDAEQVAQLR